MFKWGVIGTGSIANTVFGQITGSGSTARAARQIFEPGKTERQTLGIFIPTVGFHFRRTPVRERPKRFRALFCRAPADAFG